MNAFNSSPIGSECMQYSNVLVRHMLNLLPMRISSNKFECFIMTFLKLLHSLLQVSLADVDTFDLESRPAPCHPGDECG